MQIRRGSVMGACGLVLALVGALSAAPPPAGGGGFGERVAKITGELRQKGKTELGKALLSEDAARVYAALALAPSLDVRVSQDLLLKLLGSGNAALRRAAGLRYLLQYQEKGFQELGHRMFREESGWQELAGLFGDLARSDKPVSANARQALIECASGATQKGAAGLRCIEELTLVPGKDVATALVNLSTNWSPLVKEKALAVLGQREGKGLDVDAIINRPPDEELGAARLVSGGNKGVVKKGVVLPMTPAELVAWDMPANFADYVTPGFSKTEVLIRLRKLGKGFGRINPEDPWGNHPALYEGMSYQPPNDLPPEYSNHEECYARGPH